MSAVPADILSGAVNTVDDQASYGIVIAGHGSRDADAVREFEALVEIVRARAPGRVVTHGYLEFSSPTIGEAVEANLAAGSKQVAVVPGVLLAARGMPQARA